MPFPLEMPVLFQMPDPTKWRSPGHAPRNKNGLANHRLPSNGPSARTHRSTPIRSIDRVKPEPTVDSMCFTTVYNQLGIDTNTVTLADPSGRPQYIVDHRELIKEMI